MRVQLLRANAAAYPSLEPLIAGRINVALIRAHWSEILRVAASIHTGIVTASLILRQLASYPRQNGLAAALRELGRARTHAVHARLAGGCATAPPDQPGT
jgi:TnpA family transposase